VGASVAQARRGSVLTTLAAGAMVVATLIASANSAANSASAGEVVVAIDAGHGGIDPGASAEGVSEKQVVLEFAHLLALHIDHVPGLRAFLIRDDDSFLTLSQRVRRAREGSANLIISLHADTTHEGRAEGAHVYTLSREGTDEAAIELAERENRADVIGGVSLAGEPDDMAALLVDLAQRGTGDETEKLAKTLLLEMAGSVTLLPTQPHRKANFRVLKAPEIPSILVELGYLSNTGDRSRMASREWRERLAAALTRGIQGWTSIASPGFLLPKK
jgi:N-acetylmuramoyl-L-alanine amidase